MSNWGPSKSAWAGDNAGPDKQHPVTFNVGSSVSSFPMAIFKTIGPVTIRFNLSSSQSQFRFLLQILAVLI